MKRSFIFLLAAFFILSGFRPLPLLAGGANIIAQTEGNGTTTTTNSDATTTNNSTTNNKKKDTKKPKKDNPEETKKGVDADITVTPQWVNGANQSAKFNEYREIITGVKGGFGVTLHSNTYLVDVHASNIELTSNDANNRGDINEDDKHLDVETNFYNSFKAGLTYDQIPHRFAYNAETMFSGAGTGMLTLGTAPCPGVVGNTTVQSCLQNAEYGAGGSTVKLETALNTVFPAAASPLDLELFRNRWGLNLQSTGLGAFVLSSNLNWEHREGDRPFMVTNNGFSNINEIPEPINYDTFNGKVAAEYNEKFFLLKGAYTFSSFSNNIPSVTLSNPFMAADSFTAALQQGAEERFSSYPSNNYNDFSFTGAWRSKAPFKQTLTAFGSWGMMSENAPLIPYTINAAMVHNAYAGIPASSNPPCTVSLLSCLYATDGGVTNINASVSTALLNVLYNAKPLSFLGLTGRYRYYNYNDTTQQITFAGYARYDSSWVGGPITNTPLSYHHSTWEGEADFDVTNRTRFLFNYTNDRWNRQDREVQQSTEDIYKVSLESREFDMLDFRASYETSRKDGLEEGYDPTAAANFYACYPWLQNSTNLGQYSVYVDGFGGCPGVPPPAYSLAPTAAQKAALTLYTPPGLIPWLEKYDEAGYNHDELQLLATLMPTDSFTLTAQVINGKKIYDHSIFGLLWDKTNLWSVEGDFQATDGVDLYASYAREGSNNNELMRQWNPTCPSWSATGFADPYCGANQNPFPSFSNWSAESTDRTNTIGGGIKAQIIPDKFRVDADYLLTNEFGFISFNSPLGVATNDLNPFVPADFPSVDSSKLNTLNIKFTYNLNSGNTIGLGYMWENMSLSDFNLNGFSYFPATPAGAFNTVLMMNSLPQSYDVSTYYATYTVRF